MGSKGGAEERLTAAANIPFVGLRSKGLQKALSLQNVVAGAALSKGVYDALWILRKFGPDVVIGTGGHAAAAVVLAQALRRGKTVIVEPDVIPGRTNLALGRFASKICLAFEDAVARFPGRRTVVTGLPIRSELKNLPEKAAARAELGLDPSLFTVLVVGGSQGARHLNEVVCDALHNLRKLPIQILHQTGAGNFESVDKVARGLEWPNYHPSRYFDNMAQIYAAADFVVCRSGASTIAEITMVGLPAILVPYPYAHANHQWFNADVIARNGAGILIEESKLDAKLLSETIERCVKEPVKLKAMAEASKKLAKPDAARDIARIALDIKKL